LVERVLGKDEVTSSILVNGSTLLRCILRLNPFLMVEILLVLIFVVLLVLIFIVLRGQRPLDLNPIMGRLDNLDRAQERSERALQADLSTQRQEAAGYSSSLRAEVLGVLALVNENAERNHEHMHRSLVEVQQTVEKQLTEIRGESEKKLEQIRVTVDEKLQGTLETRLGESFKLVSERLEQVHRGLGEMQALAGGVGDLKRVLTNVRTRGTWGEVQLGSLLEQILAPEQYACNVATTGTSERVEFAIKLPGRDVDQSQVWLPIDSKFPLETYQRLVDASERVDVAGVEAALKELERTLDDCARTISTKYVSVPATTDFAILFLATEGLYAEAHRRSGLAESIQRKYRVSLAGPSSLAALLNSLQMGFRTLAIQKRSSEVWKVLGEVKTEFGRYADVLEQVKKKLDEASKKIDDASQRTRALDRRLRTVEAAPEQGLSASPE
jgi:DNA recombination protein RmuC